MNDPYKDLDREIDLGHHGREEARERAKALARDWAKREQAESAEVGRIIILYGIVLPVCVLALLWLWLRF